MAIEKKKRSIVGRMFRISKGMSSTSPLLTPPRHPSVSPTGRDGNRNDGSLAVVETVPGKVGKKKVGSRLWMRFDRSGESEMIEWDKSAIIRRAGIPARDLRILGPVFSHSSNILAREKAMVVNLEFVKAIITAQEVLLPEPLSHEVIPFIDQLRQQLPIKSPTWTQAQGSTESEQPELPFEFQVLEIALDTVCTFLESSVLDLERNAYPVLDELATNVSTKNLERVRSLKSNLTRLLARVQKVKDEIEHLLDDNEDMAHLYLTRKQIQSQQFEALMADGVSYNFTSVQPSLARMSSHSHRSVSMTTSAHSDDNVEDLEMLLEAYFTQLDGTRNKILSVREYIDDTEDYVNIQLDNHRNELIQLQLTLTIASFAIAINTFIAGAFAMNMPCQLYRINGVFWPFVGGTSSACFMILLVILGYARWKKLLRS